MGLIDELRERISGKRREAKKLCEAATAVVETEIEQLNGELQKALKTQAAEHAKVYEVIVTQIGELAEISMRLLVFHGIDLELRIAHYVESIQLKDIDANDEFSTKWYRYMDYHTKEPVTQYLDEALEYAKQTLANCQEEGR